MIKKTRSVRQSKFEEIQNIDNSAFLEDYMEVLYKSRENEKSYKYNKWFVYYYIHKETCELKTMCHLMLHQPWEATTKYFKGTQSRVFPLLEQGFGNSKLGDQNISKTKNHGHDQGKETQNKYQKQQNCTNCQH